MFTRGSIAAVSDLQGVLFCQKVKIIVVGPYMFTEIEDITEKISTILVILIPEHHRK